jgi:hypothetical protein
MVGGVGTFTLQSGPDFSDFHLFDLKISTYCEGFFDTDVGVQCEVCCQLLGLLLDCYCNSMDNSVVCWDTFHNS